MKRLLAMFVVFAVLLSALPMYAFAAPRTPVTVITVNSTADLDTSDSTTCASKPAEPCTLRRAVIQARNLPANQKPVQIAFNIPDTDPNYNPTLGIWKITFIGISSNANATLRYLNGQISIDGSTQPGGRSVGPKIILVAPGTGQWDGIKLGENATQNANEIRGLGFQMFKTHIYANSSSNLIENNWFGLSDDGTDVVLRGGGDDDGSGNTGISVGSGTTGNTIQNNVFTGLAGVAAALNGDNGIFANNFIGTIADGTVPGKTTDPNLTCTQWDWLGGSGVSIGGDANTLENNVFAGIRIAVEPPTIQADTLRVSGDENIIRNNNIGLDVNDDVIGVCGRGVYLQSGTEFNQVSNNHIVEPGLSAISLNDTPTVSTSDANTLRTNIIIKSSAWGQIDGNDNPEDAIQITKSLPTAFRNFKPAAVTVINGVNISGTSGASSPCPNCTIEIFLDDTDTINEALESLAIVTADGSGNWQATLPAPLTAGQGLRTTSTTNAPNIISGMSAGTTTGLSELYEPIRFDHFEFATIASPQTVGVPFAVTLTAIDNYGNPIAITGNVTLADTTGSISPSSLAFSAQSSRTFNVTITQANFSVKISATYASATAQSNAFAVQQQSDWTIYLPLVTR